MLIIHFGRSFCPVPTSLGGHCNVPQSRISQPCWGHDPRWMRWIWRERRPCTWPAPGVKSKWWRSHPQPELRRHCTCWYKAQRMVTMEASSCYNTLPPFILQISVRNLGGSLVRDLWLRSVPTYMDWVELGSLWQQSGWLCLQPCLEVETHLFTRSRQGSGLVVHTQSIAQIVRAFCTL